MISSTQSVSDTMLSQIRASASYGTNGISVIYSLKTSKDITMIKLQMKIIVLALLTGCSSGERPIMDFQLESYTLSQARIAGIATEVSHTLGYGVTMNDPDIMAGLSSYNANVSIWINNGSRTAANLVTVNTSGKIGVMIFASGTGTKSEAKRLEQGLREAFKNPSNCKCEVEVLYTKPEKCIKKSEMEGEGLIQKLVIEELQERAYKLHANTVYLAKIVPTKIEVHDYKEPIAIHYQISAEAYDCQ